MGQLEIQSNSFGKSRVARMLWPMSTLADRITHALELREMKRGHLDEELARRLGKKGRGSGYVYRLIERGQQPRSEQLRTLADILRVSHRWLLTGEGPIEPDDTSTSTYDSLPGWAAAAAEEIQRRRIPDFAIRATGRSPVFVAPREITADFVFRAAMFWLENAPEDDRKAAMKAETARIKTTEDGH